MLSVLEAKNSQYGFLEEHTVRKTKYSLLILDVEKWSHDYGD